MRNYLVLIDKRKKTYGLQSRLIYPGARFHHIINYQNNPGRIAFFHLRQRLAPIGATPQEILQEYFNQNLIPADERAELDISPLNTMLGYQYGRVHRPANGFGSAVFTGPNQNETNFLLDAYSQLDGYMHRLTEISRVVHISNDNLSAHGYEIRSLLILACTEVEILFKHLIWEDYSSARGAMTDFFKVNSFAKLDKCTVRFKNFRDIGTITPFEEWSNAASYKPLDWYRAYNSTKHGRAPGSDGANLRAAITALAACAVLLSSHYPHTMFSSLSLQSITNFDNHFKLEMPRWAMEDMYWTIPSRRLKFSKIPGT